MPSLPLIANTALAVCAHLSPVTNALLALAHSYESKSQFHLAVPLFLQALRLCNDPCHSAVISMSPPNQPQTPGKQCKTDLKNLQ